MAALDPKREITLEQLEAHHRLLELVRAQASRALLEAEGYSWFEITAARAEIARERPR